MADEDRPERDEQSPADDDARETAPESSSESASDSDSESSSESSRPAGAAARRERRSAESRPAGRASKDSESGDSKSDKDSRPAKSSKDSERKGARTTLSGRREDKVSPPARLLRFLREVVAELRKVIWPTRKELVTYTIVVLIFVSFMVAFVQVLDIAFARGVLWLFG